MTDFSVLDLVPVREGGAVGDALAEAGANTIFSDMADLPALIWGTSP